MEPASVKAPAMVLVVASEKALEKLSRWAALLVRAASAQPSTWAIPAERPELAWVGSLSVRKLPAARQ
jgi:hypothetical protein